MNLTNCITSHGSTLSDDLLGFRLLKRANLPEADEKLARGTTKLTYKGVKDQLKKLFSEAKSLEGKSSVDSCHIEDINLQET